MNCSPGGYAIYTALDTQAQAAAEELFANGANFPDPAADGTPAQAALVAEERANGEIVAIVGGRTYDVRLGLNRATQIRRQPGSAIKPVSAYAAAIEGYGYLPTSFVDDTPRVFAGGYQPGNAGGNYYGEVTLREALSRSLNVATVDLAEKVGVSALRAQLERFGITPAERDADLALALGSMTEGVSPARLCAAYCALANGGQRVEPHTVRKIVASDGAVLYEAPQAEERAVSAETACMRHGHAAHRRRGRQRQRPQRRGDERGRQDGHGGHGKRRQPRRLDGGLHAEAGRGRVDGL